MATAAVVALWWVGAVAVAEALALVLALAVAVVVAVAMVSPPFPCAPASAITDSLFQIKQFTGQRGDEGGPCITLAKSGSRSSPQPLVNGGGKIR